MPRHSTTAWVNSASLRCFVCSTFCPHPVTVLQVCPFGRAITDNPKGDLDHSGGTLDPSTKTVIKGNELYPAGTQEEYPAMMDSRDNLLIQSAHEYAECSNRFRWKTSTFGRRCGGSGWRSSAPRPWWASPSRGWCMRPSSSRAAPRSATAWATTLDNADGVRDVLSWALSLFQANDEAQDGFPRRVYGGQLAPMDASMRWAAIAALQARAAPPPSLDRGLEVGRRPPEAPPLRPPSAPARGPPFASRPLLRGPPWATCGPCLADPVAPAPTCA